MSSNNETHSDVRKKEFLCEFCDKKLASKFSLDRHKLVCKKSEINDKNTIRNVENTIRNVENTIQNFENAIPQVNKRFNCKKCDKGYNTLRLLNDHEPKCKGLNVLTCPRCTERKARSRGI